MKKEESRAVARKGTEILKNDVLGEGLVTNIYHTHV